jgi:hypothetical protein
MKLCRWGGEALLSRCIVVVSCRGGSELGSGVGEENATGWDISTWDRFTPGLSGNQDSAARVVGDEVRQVVLEAVGYGGLAAL